MNDNCLDTNSLPLGFISSAKAPIHHHHINHLNRNHHHQSFSLDIEQLNVGVEGSSISAASFDTDIETDTNSGGQHFVPVEITNELVLLDNDIKCSDEATNYTTAAAALPITSEHLKDAPREKLDEKVISDDVKLCSPSIVGLPSSPTLPQVKLQQCSPIIEEKKQEQDSKPVDDTIQEKVDKVASPEDPNKSHLPSSTIPALAQLQKATIELSTKNECSPCSTPVTLKSPLADSPNLHQDNAKQQSIDDGEEARASVKRKLSEINTITSVEILKADNNDPALLKSSCKSHDETTESTSKQSKLNEPEKNESMQTTISMTATNIDTDSDLECVNTISPVSSSTVSSVINLNNLSISSNLSSPSVQLSSSQSIAQSQSQDGDSSHVCNQQSNRHLTNLHKKPNTNYSSNSGSNSSVTGNNKQKPTIPLALNSNMINKKDSTITSTSSNLNDSFFVINITSSGNDSLIIESVSDDVIIHIGFNKVCLFECFKFIYIWI
jgi:hypothetical protein